MTPSRLCPRCDTPLEREEHLFQTYRGRFPDICSIIWYCEACGWWEEVGEHSDKVLASSDDPPA